MEERKGLSSSVDKDTSASEDINEKFSKNDPENEPFWSELIQKDSFPQDEGIHKKKEEKEGKEKERKEREWKEKAGKKWKEKEEKEEKRKKEKKKEKKSNFKSLKTKEKEK